MIKAAKNFVQAKIGVLSLVIIFTIIFLVLIYLLHNFFYLVLPTRIYLILHSILEIFSIIVASSVFMISWYGSKQAYNQQDMIISLTFLSFIMFNLAHTLSYSGMPEFLSPNSVNKASTYWILCILVNAIGLLTASQVSPSIKNRPPNLLWAVNGVLVLTFLLIFIIAYYPHFLPPMFIVDQGQTNTKILLEYLAIFLNILTLFCFNRYKKEENNHLVFLNIALLLTIFSELAFTFYSDAYDIFNLFGHLLQLLAYYFILQALFVSSLRKPYLQLCKSKEKIQELADNNSFLYQQARKQRMKLENSFTLIGEALSSRLDLNQTLQLIVNLAADMLDADYALVALGRNEIRRLKVVAAKGMAQPPNFIPIENSLAGKAYKNGISFWIKNAANNPSVFLPQPLNNRIQCIVAAPIISKNIVLGVLELYFEKKTTFQFRQSQLFSAFARHAGAALETSYLFQETRRRLKEQQVLYKLVTDLSSPLSLEEVLKECILCTVQALEAAEGSIFLLKETEGTLLEEVAASKVDSNQLSEDTRKYIDLKGNSTLASLINKNQPSFFYNINQQKNEAAVKNWWRSVPILLILPLFIKNKTVGALFLGWENKEKQFPPSVLNLAATIAQQLALGIEKNKLYKEVEKLALTDPLTGLANRRRFDFYLEHELARVANLQQPICLIMLDLDKFKHYNDTYGHLAGDKVLAKIGQILQKYTRSMDLPARYGGEEFSIILPNSNFQQGLIAAEKIREAIENDYFPDTEGNSIVKITASLGITNYQPEINKREVPSKEQLINEADQALYQAKNSGRNKVCAFKG